MTRACLSERPITDMSPLICDSCVVSADGDLTPIMMRIEGFSRMQPERLAELVAEDCAEHCSSRCAKTIVDTEHGGLGWAPGSLSQQRSALWFASGRIVSRSLVAATRDRQDKDVLSW